MRTVANRHWIIVSAGEVRENHSLSQNCMKLLFAIAFISSESQKWKHSGFYLAVRIFGNPKRCFMSKPEEPGFEGC